MMSGMNAFDTMGDGDLVGELLGAGAEVGVGAGASYAFGHMYHRYGNRWYGRGAPKIIGPVCKIAAVVGKVFLGDHAGFNVLDAVGQAGLNAMALEYGLRHARKATGRRPVMLAAGAPLPPGAEEVTSVGALPPAAPGVGLDWNELSELAKAR